LLIANDAGTTLADLIHYMSENAFQAPSPGELSQLLPQYDIEFFIAQGGMGAVYKGRQISLDRDIAIKVLPREMVQSKEFLDSFVSEAKSMARLNHPNLLGVFDYGDVEGMPYIVMEYVDGGSLHQAAWNQAVEPLQAVSIVKGICDGLAHAHEQGIVHRDIKPSNILLTPSIEAKVADFGLAHATDSDMPGLVMGTPGYTAPEVFQDPNQAGNLADIYSVGVILHQLLTSCSPASTRQDAWSRRAIRPATSASMRSGARRHTHIPPSATLASQRWRQNWISG
jgi:serine/threonine protein kinase